MYHSEKTKPFILLLCGFVLLISCNSNSLKQVEAEKTIREFLTNNSFETSKENVSLQTIIKIGKTNIYSQFNTSVRVYFTEKEGKALIIIFIFTRTSDNRWFLKSIEADTDVSKELREWLETKKKLNIVVDN